MYRLNFQKLSPTLLKQYIAAFYIYHFDANSDVQLFPKGFFEIVFQSGGRFQHNTSYSSGWQTRPQNFIGGLHNKSYHVKSCQKNSYCIVVELYNYGSDEAFDFRGSWSKNGDGSMRQFFEQYNDETGMWEVWFDGRYVRQSVRE